MKILPVFLFSFLLSGWWHVDCEGDIGWVPASFIKPLYDDDNDDTDSIVTESFIAGKGKIYHLS